MQREKERESCTYYSINSMAAERPNQNPRARLQHLFCAPDGSALCVDAWGTSQTRRDMYARKNTRIVCSLPCAFIFLVCYFLFYFLPPPPLSRHMTSQRCLFLMRTSYFLISYRVAFVCTRNLVSS
jgi:hypothetical protein